MEMTELACHELVEMAGSCHKYLSIQLVYEDMLFFESFDPMNVCNRPYSQRENRRHYRVVATIDR
jgi:hypothetical protein